MRGRQGKWRGRSFRSGVNGEGGLEDDKEEGRGVWDRVWERKVETDESERAERLAKMKVEKSLALDIGRGVAVRLPALHGPRREGTRC